jgi:hypothetical protein
LPHSSKGRTHWKPIDLHMARLFSTRQNRLIPRTEVTKIPRSVTSPPVPQADISRPTQPANRNRKKLPKLSPPRQPELGPFRKPLHPRTEPATNRPNCHPPASSNRVRFANRSIREQNPQQIAQPVTTNRNLSYIRVHLRPASSSSSPAQPTRTAAFSRRHPPDPASPSPYPRWKTPAASAAR